MANLNDALKDPDFWGPETTDDDRKWVLGKVDKNFRGYTPAQQDVFLKNLAKSRQDEQAREQQDQQQRAMAVAPKVQEQQTWFQRAVAPVTDVAGRAVEMATQPLVTAARYAQGEPLAAQTTQVPGTGKSITREGALAGGPIGAGGVAGQTRQQVASNLVPQSPWQAGAVASQFIPGVGQAGSLARIGAAAGGAGLLQGLLGAKGLVEGGTPTQALQEGAVGAAKGGATQMVGEGVGKLLGAGARHTPGLGKAVNNYEARQVQKGAAELAPELSGAGKTAADIGEFYKQGGAQKATSDAFRAKLSELENSLINAQGHPYIDTPELRVAFRQIVKSSDPVAANQVKEMAPTAFGFTPDQVSKIVAMTRQRMSTGEGTALHMKDAAVDDLVASIEKSLPASLQGRYSAARGSVAKSSALQELMSAAFQPGPKGYKLDMPKLQEAVSNDPDLIKRLTKEGFGDLVQVITRGKTRQAGFADQPAGNWNFVPVSSTGVKATLLKHLLQRYRYVGEKPLTAPPGVKAGLGVATTLTAGRKGRED